MARYVRLLILLLLLSGCRIEEQGAQLFQSGEQALASGRYILAEQSYEQYLQAHPNASMRWQAWNRLLLIAEKIRRDHHRSQEILQSMSLEFESDPARTQEVLHRLALVYRDGLGQPERAVDVWLRSLKYCSQTPEGCWFIHWHIASTHFERGQFPEAREELLLSLELADTPDRRAETLYMMAKSYALTDERSRALEWLDRLMDLDGYEGEFRSLAAYMAADIHAQEGRAERARTLLASIVDSHPNPELIRLRLEQLGATSH